MARDNQLALHIDGEMALPFLEEGQSAEANLQWLDKYLVLIAAARRNTGSVHRDLDRCIDIAAQYLYSTDWFEGTSPTELAHVANKLSKHPGQPACMQALAWIAEQVEQAESPLRLERYAPLLLLNAFSKNPASGSCERAVARLARQMRYGQGRRSADARTIGLELNAFSKWPDNPHCRSRAHALAAVLADNKRLCRAMDRQNIANTLNAMAKWPDVRACAAAAGALAARLAADGGLRERFFPVDVTQSLHALGKWPDIRVCAEAAFALATRLAGDRALRAVLRPQEMSDALTGLSKWPDTRVCQAVADALAARLAEERGLAGGFNAQQVANTLNALSKWPELPACQAAVRTLARRLADGNGLCDGLRPQALASSLNALSRSPDTAACAAAATALAARLADEPTLRDDLEPRHLANALNGLGKWPDAPACEAAAIALASRLLDDPVFCGKLAPLDVSNALGGMSKWPATPVCRTTAQLLATRLVDDPVLREALSSGQVSNTLVSLSKWDQTEVCRAAARALAVRLADERDLRDQLQQSWLTNALNALSKWPDTPVCAEAADALAARLADEPALRASLDQQGVITALNALCKWPGTPACAAAASALAHKLVDEPGVRASLDQQGVSNALNALVKWDETEVCQTAAHALAARLGDDRALRNTLQPQSISNAMSALSKWPDTPVCATAGNALALRLAHQHGLRSALQALDVAHLLNAMGKWPDMPACAAAAGALASRLTGEPVLCETLDARGVAIALNGLSKWPDTPACAEAACALAGRLAEDGDVCEALDPQGVANALNALSKWPDAPACATAAGTVARRLAKDRRLSDALRPMGVANALNALGKWPECAHCARAVDTLAERLVADADMRREMEALHTAVSLHALCRSLERSACRQACLLVAGLPGSAEVPWQQFDMGALAMVGNAMSRMMHVEEEAFQTVGRARLQAITGHLELHPERFDSASTSEIGLLFKAFSAAQLQRRMRPLAGPALDRVAALVRADGLRDTNLEGLGTLCLGLLPAIHHPELTQRHRSRALRVFDSLQPIADRKIDAYLAAGGVAAPVTTDQYGTRCPALTFFQVLRAYASVSRQWKPRNVEGDRQTIRQRREELAKWVERTLERTRECIEADLGSMSWNLIAQIESGDQLFEALDRRMAKEAPHITQVHPPTRIDLEAGRMRMRSAPGQPVAPAAGAGDPRHVVVDLQGREVARNAAEANTRYSLFTRLTGLPLVEVQLPGTISAFMLARVFYYQGEPWRFDMLGGSRTVRGNTKTPAQLLSGGSPLPSMLPAIRYADTAPGSPLMQLVAKLAPQREDWSRMQRSLLEMVPSDHVVEGTLRLGFFDDVNGPAHPFKPAASDGRPLALCPNDGCGFVKLEVALRIPAFRAYVCAWEAVQSGRASQEQRDLVVKDKGSLRMAPQALQHFPRDEAALQEAHEAMRRRLRTLPSEPSPLLLYQLATSGGYEGERIRAVPSADDKVHLPSARSRAFDAAGGALLIGKPPYDKENLLPVPQAQVATVVQGDATAEFLSRAFGIQYSYTGFDEGSGDDAEMLHSKGMLIVVPPENWPAQFADRDMVCSKEDLKTLSRWTHGRDRAAVPRDMLGTGSLRLKDIVEPGRLGALPIPELRKRNMDTDGDDAFVYAGYPRLAALISREMADREARRGQAPSFKPPKTATPAIDPDSGHYQAGRLSEIMALQRGGQVMAAASSLAARFMVQPDPLREAMARSMMLGTYDGIERALRNGLRLALEGEAWDAQVLADLRARAQDAIGRAHMPVAREAAEVLYAQLLRIEPGAAAPAGAAPRLPDALAEAFPRLAQAYEAAPDAAARIHAILDNYPVCRLSHTEYPDGQPGLVPGEPELSMRNLFTIAIKVGTDALKSDTGTQLFSKIVDACEATERAFPGRVSEVPYGKTTARAIHGGRFDPVQTRSLLQTMPTMAAGVMEDALQVLQQAGLIDPPPPPDERLRAVRPEDIERAAHVLATRARDMEPAVTAMLERAARTCRGRLEGTQLQLKSHGSLRDKLMQQIGVKQQSLEKAAAGVNDALRYSVVLDPQDFTAGLRGVLASLDDQGHLRVKLSNQFAKRRQAFKAVNVTLRSPEGALWEIQFHTPDTFRLKEKFHDLYKHSRALQLRGAPSAEQRELVLPAQDAFGRVETPPGCEDIDDWEEPGG